MFRENKIFDSIGKIHEDKKNGDVLDPAPLDDLPEAWGVGESLFRVLYFGRQGEVRKPFARHPS